MQGAREIRDQGATASLVDTLPIPERFVLDARGSRGTTSRIVHLTLGVVAYDETRRYGPWPSQATALDVA